MTIRRKNFEAGGVAVLLAFAGTLALGVPQAAADTATTCPALGQGYWKTHPSAWATLMLTLGTSSYTQLQAETILHHPGGGDASEILAVQLN